MMTTAILVISAILVLVVLFVTARGRAGSVSEIAQLQGKTQPVDLVAFRNLTDPVEEKYLRENLPARDFRMVQRERLRAAMEYVDAVAGNAAVLLRLGEAARRSANPQVAEAGMQLVNRALRVRLYALSAKAQLGAAILWPGVHVSPAAVTDVYQQLTRTVSRLGYLQNSAPARRVAAML
jgi:hypothetical protein